MARDDKHRRGNSEQGSEGRGKKHTGRRRSDPNEPLADPAVELNGSLEGEQELKGPHASERRFNILVDSVPYMIKATPFTFNGEIRYKVSFNESAEHVFTWDSSLGQLRAIDDDASTLPDNLEEAISEKLQSNVR